MATVTPRTVDAAVSLAAYALDRAYHADAHPGDESAQWNQSPTAFPQQPAAELLSAVPLFGGIFGAHTTNTLKAHLEQIALGGHGVDWLGLATLILKNLPILIGLLQQAGS